MIAASPRTPSNAATSELATWISALQVWLIAGCAAVVFVPAMRGIDPWFGWLPFWLIVAPALDLAVLRRRWFIAFARARLLRFRAQRNSARRQARSWRRRISIRRMPQAAAIAAKASSQSVMPRRLRSMRRRNSPMMRR